MTKKTSAKAPAKKAKAKTKKVVARTAPATAIAEEEVVEEVVAAAPEPENILKLHLSASLIKKINEQAADEGLTPTELVTELLSEAVVVRAWEIVERRIAMRQGGNSKPQHINGNGNGNGNGGHRNGGRRHNNRRGGMSNSRYQNIMDDRASFLEYVRNQERQGR